MAEASNERPVALILTCSRNTDEELRVLLEEEGAQLSAADWPLYMPALNGPRRMEVIWDGLGKRGFSSDHREKLMAGNLYRIWKDVLG